MPFQTHQTLTQCYSKIRTKFSPKTHNFFAQSSLQEENGYKTAHKLRLKTRPMKNIHSSMIKLPSSGILEMEVIPIKNAYVHMESVDLNLGNFDEWKLASIYMHRARSCCGESCLDLLLDQKRLKVFHNKMTSEVALLPNQGRFQCVYVVTRPMKSLLRGSHIEGEAISLDLACEADYQLCMYLRSYCMGSDVSTRSCWVGHQPQEHPRPRV